MTAASSLSRSSHGSIITIACIRTALSAIDPHVSLLIVQPVRNCHAFRGNNSWTGLIMDGSWVCGISRHE